MQNALPQWHTHSTISGDQTGLGLAHDERQARIASNGKGRAANGADAGLAEGAGGNEQDGKSRSDTRRAHADLARVVDLSAYYASLGAQPPAAESTVKAEPAPAPADDDEDDEMEDVSAGPSNAAGPSTSKAPVPAADKADDDEFEETPVPAASVNSTEETAEGVDPNTMVMGMYHLPHLVFWTNRSAIVNGEAMPFSQVQDNEDLLDQMTADEYSVSGPSADYVLDFLTALSLTSRRTSVCWMGNRRRDISRPMGLLRPCIL
jgi:hypothetical protein